MIEKQCILGLESKMERWKDRTVICWYIRCQVLVLANYSGFFLSDFSSFRFLCVFSSSSKSNMFRVRQRQPALKEYMYHTGICSPQTFL